MNALGKLNIKFKPTGSPCEARNFLEKLASMSSMLAITSTKTSTKEYFNQMASMLKDETISKNKNDVTTTIYIDNDANMKITKIVKNIVINSLNERLTTTTKVESLNENTLKLTLSLDKEEINTMKTFINKKLNNLFAVLNVIINKNVGQFSCSN